MGFELQGLNGTRRLLAHVDFPSRHRVARYRVDTKGFDTFLKKMDLMGSDADLIVIDEIGKMELFSRRFRNLVRELLDSEKKVLATIARQGGGMIKEIKSRSDLAIFEVTSENRNQLIADILKASH
jgi:nucleoside-triphosphatase THEP1